MSILQKPRPKHRLSMFSTVQKHCLAMLHCGWPIIRKAGAPVLPKNLHGLGLSDIKTKKNISSNMCGHLRKPELYDNIFLIFLRSVRVGTERLTAKPYILQKILFQCLAWEHRHSYLWPPRFWRLLKAKNPLKSMKEWIFFLKLLITVV